MGNCPEALDCLDAPDRIPEICYRGDDICGLCELWTPVEVGDDEDLLGKCREQKEDVLLPCDKAGCKQFVARDPA